MKRTFQILGAAMLALAMVACQNEPIIDDNTPVTPDEPVVEEPAELVLRANLPETRTALDTETFKVSWAAVDELAVFNAPTGTADYSDNLHFITKVVGEGEEATAQLGVFVPAEGIEVPFEDGVNYDWYVLHPWRTTGGDVEMKTPKGESKEDGYFPIGAQTQTGYNDATHVSGSDPLVGKVANTREPNVTLKHLAVLHKFTVTNNSDKPTTITKLTLNGGENKLFGTFWLDLTADEPAIDIEKANGTFNERALTVKEGTELAVGASADFYMVTAPFTLNTGETLKMTIETSSGTQVIEKTATADIDFKAGTYNTASLVYDYKIVYADHLYYEKFNPSTALESLTTTNLDVRPARWTSYDKGGMSVYDGDVSAVSYTNAVNSTITRQVAASALKGMDDLHARLGDGKTYGSIDIEGIKLYGKTKLNLSLLQTYKNSQLKVEYSVDKGETWTELITWTNPTTATCEERSQNFEVAEGSEVIYLRLTGLGKTSPRFDNIKLTWQ